MNLYLILSMLGLFVTSSIFAQTDTSDISLLQKKIIADEIKVKYEKNQIADSVLLTFTLKITKENAEWIEFRFGREPGSGDLISGTFQVIRKDSEDYIKQHDLSLTKVNKGEVKINGVVLNTLLDKPTYLEIVVRDNSQNVIQRLSKSFN